MWKGRERFRRRSYQIQQTIPVVCSLHKKMIFFFFRHRKRKLTLENVNFHAVLATVQLIPMHSYIHSLVELKNVYLYMFVYPSAEWAFAWEEKKCCWVVQLTRSFQTERKIYLLVKKIKYIEYAVSGQHNICGWGRGRGHNFCLLSHKKYDGFRKLFSFFFSFRRNGAH